MGEVGVILVAIIVLLIAVPALVVAVIFLAKPVFKGIGWLIKHIFKFIGNTLLDLLKLFGAIITSLVLVPLTLINVLIGRWSSSAHYGRAIESELKAAVGCLYRIVIGNPARLLLLTPLTEGIEKRIPAAVAHAPGADRPSKRQGQFEGYIVVGSLPGGGSGGKLFIAEPTDQKLAAFSRGGQNDVDRVVIKSFSLADGSTLPQIVRENRALPAAKRLGLILEHELTEDRFYYVTRYVPGESLSLAIQRMHAMTGGGGLSGIHLTEALDYAADVVRTLHTYHSGGLWHKDVKPDNVIVSDGQAHLVDFGLVTPLRSSMTLTTHGTEYFRDPEMVRMALRGVKVHEVDGAKFDIYAAGAVLYAIIENSFPAHGGLSQISKKCPEAIRWIIRRAMTEYDKRYDSSATMLTDLETVLTAPDPFALRPVDLPSMQGGGDAQAFVAGYTPDVDEVGAGRVGPSVPPPIPAAARTFVPAVAPMLAGGTPQQAARPALRLSSWWTGRYELDPRPTGSHDAAAGTPMPPAGRVPGMTAVEQRARARQRARDARMRARVRLSSRRRDYPSGANVGVFFALGVLVVGMAIFVLNRMAPNVMRSASNLATLIPNDESEPTVSESAPDATESSESVDFSQLPITVAAAPPAMAAPMPSAEITAPARPTVTVPFDHVGVDARETKPTKRHPRKPAVNTVHDSAPGSTLPPSPKARVFVLKDHMTFDKEQQATVDARLARLSSGNYGLLGLTTPNADADPAIVERETTLSAELRSAIGMSPFQSNGAADAIRTWLDQHADIQVVIWIDQDDQAKPSMWIIPRRDLGSSVTESLKERLMSKKS